jgi:hypothetical protein
MRQQHADQQQADGTQIYTSKCLTHLAAWKESIA